ncbi:MAG: efflux RND transporter permease subunit, partial [Pseudomonadota bacterium]
ADEIVLATPGIQSAFSFAGDGGLNTGGPGGAGGPSDTIGQIQVEMVPWEDRPTVSEPWFEIFGTTINANFADPAFDGDIIGEEVLGRLRELPGIKVDLSSQERGPAQGKPVHLRLTGQNWDELQRATADAGARFNDTPALIDIEDTLPLPGIDWEIQVDVEKAGRFGANVATVGAMVQLVTRGILLDTMRVDTSDEEIEIRVRLPEKDRLLSTLDTLKVRTNDGLIPLANFVTRRAVPQLAEINRYDAERYFDVKADVQPGRNIVKIIPPAPDGESDTEISAAQPIDLGFGREIPASEVAADPGTAQADGSRIDWTLASPKTGLSARIASVFGGDPLTYRYFTFENGLPATAIDNAASLLGLAPGATAPEAVIAVAGDARFDLIDPDGAGGATLTSVPITATERIEFLTEQLSANGALPASVSFEWTGDQEEQAESQAFLFTAFTGALGLMFIILLAQFNSIYNSVLVLLAVVLSTTGVFIGMMVMGQAFSIIMTGTGIVALAGIVVNNNIVLIDTYQDYSRYMPRIEAITRTAEDRIRPVLLTTLTTMAGLAPMMFGLSINFVGGGYSIGSPTALWWIQLATAVVWGLGVATVLTLLFTPSMLAARVWAVTYALALFRVLGRMGFGRASQTGRDWTLRRQARKIKAPTLLWAEEETPETPSRPMPETLPTSIATPVPEESDSPDKDPERPHPPLRAAE